MLKTSKRQRAEGPALGATASKSEIVIGVLEGFDDSGSPLVDWPENPFDVPVSALATEVYSHSDLGRSAAILFAGGDSLKPVVIGLIRQPLDDVLQATIAEDELPRPDDPEVRSINGRGAVAFDATVDGKKVSIAAEDYIELVCGDASITLTRAGKILIRGAYVSSRSSGVNRIKGGSVQLN